MEPPLELLTVFAQQISQGRRRLRHGIFTLCGGGSHFPASAAECERMLVPHLLTRLRTLADRTLALELQVARLQRQLQGETSAERYQSFVDRIRRPEVARAILAEYPVLKRLVQLCIDQWVHFSLQFLRQLRGDWPELRKVFPFLHLAGNLVGLEGDSGDRHCDGKVVIVLRFQSGARLVYKPRSLAVDRRFQELLAWCNERGSHPPFRTLQVLEFGDHGWVEFVEQQDCHTTDEVRRFYRRQGSYLALLYITGATDFHFENLIAAGEHPVLVDLETLLHPRLPGSSQDPAVQGMWNSVVSIGLLPRVSYFDGFDRGIDFSGLGATTGQQIDSPIYQFESRGTDEMRLVRRESHALAGSHRPTLGGAEVAPADYGSEMLQGFAQMYRLLQQHRHFLASNTGPLAAFAETEARFIARATQIYGILLERSYHPDYLRDDIVRGHWFQQLSSQAEESPGLKPLLEAERADLDRNDIPLFRSRPGSVDLWTSRGERIANYFDQSPLANARERLLALGSADLARQTWLLRAALAKLSSSQHQVRSDPITKPNSALAPLTEAQRITDRLITLAWQDTCEAGWLGVYRHQRGWFIGPLDLDVDHGLPGVALFLAEFVAATANIRVMGLLRRTLYAVNRRLMAANRAVDMERLLACCQRIARAIAPYADSDLVDKIEQMSHLISCVDRGPYIAELQPDALPDHSAVEQETSGAIQLPPSDLEIPGLAGGLAGRGLELLRVAG